MDVYVSTPRAYEPEPEYGPEDGKAPEDVNEYRTGTRRPFRRLVRARCRRISFEGPEIGHWGAMRDASRLAERFLFSQMRCQRIGSG